MTEVTSVITRLRQTDKGKLKYDRDWASSKEGVQRVLDEISLGVNKMNLVSSELEVDTSFKEDLENVEPKNSSPPPQSVQSNRIETEVTPVREFSLSAVDKSVGSPGGTPGSTKLSRSERYFGLNPLQVNVNRSVERNIDNPRRFTFTSSPSSSPAFSSLDQSIDVSYTESKKGGTPVFEYSRGFLVKVSQTPVSVDVVRLKLENIKGLLGLDDRESSSESEDDADDDEEASDLDSSVVDQKLMNLREEMKAVTVKKNAEILQKFKEKSEQLAKDAEERYQQEVEEVRRSLKEEEDLIREEIRRDKVEAERRVAEEVAADRRRKEEVDDLLRICKEHEDRIKAEEERETRKKSQKQRFATEMSHIKEGMISMLELWSSIEDKSKFSDKSKDSVSVHSEFSDLRDDIMSKIKDGAVEEEDWSQLRALGDKMKNAAKILTDDIAAINLAEEKAKEAEVAAKRAEEEAAKEAEEAAAKAESEKIAQEQIKKAQEENKSLTPNPVAPTHQSRTISVSSEEFYREIISFKTKYVEEIVFADTEKSVKSELTKAITTTLNAISSQTMEHLNDKLEKLTYLLAGKPVTMKDGQVCAANHRFGVKYCTAILAKKIVRQGEDVVSSRAETAFPFASVALALWDTFPDFGRLLLAYFFEFCPFLAPFYPVKTEGQPEKEHYLALGYKYEKEEIEKQDKYLKRMAGLAQLFSAIITSHKPLGSSTMHPFGPTQVWKYIAQVVNMNPLADVTATILLVVLETTGNTMAHKYGDQFFKLLQFIKAHFLPKLEAIKTDGGPTVRLETFLSKVTTENRIESPKGILGVTFIKKINI